MCSWTWPLKHDKKKGLKIVFLVSKFRSKGPYTVPLTWEFKTETLTENRKKNAFWLSNSAFQSNKKALDRATYVFTWEFKQNKRQKSLLINQFWSKDLIRCTMWRETQLSESLNTEKNESSGNGVFGVRIRPVKARKKPVHRAICFLTWDSRHKKNIKRSTKRATWDVLL